MIRTHTRRILRPLMLAYLATSASSAEVKLGGLFRDRRPFWRPSRTSTKPTSGM